MDFQLILSIILGLGLSSAVGFRIFVPALITSVGAPFNYLELADSMQWMSSIPAMVTLGVANVLEIIAYYVPVLDNALDAIATPAAAVCGTLLMGSTIMEIDPLIKWLVSIIAGGGLATTIQSGTTVVRADSTGFTAGLGSPVVSTLEAIFAIVMSIISIFLPILAGIVILWLIYKLFIQKKLRREAT